MKFFNPSRNRDNFINNPPRSGGIVVPPILYTKLGLTLAPWTGVYTPIIALTSAYQRIVKTSATVVVPTVGITDNNNCSFTNSSGGPRTISGRIVVWGYLPGANQPVNILAATDASGVDLPIMANSGQWNPHIQVMPRSLSWAMEYSLVLPAGKSVFPMIKNNDNNSTFNVGTVSHTIWSRP